mmetsp:Transcript_49333/g.117367  ORF Transcript_49333/g.117367 Transcript_49333/m.117367 type:complete len:885 (+) Transcript_49333:112-2766(+)|eukprot:CAMPEP_0178404996 /NCGR_PEP_ID=MMETSP0689_2-20121128/18174_1 /TAXON_ID=160604 /ORGANISM="Amphidinium massartii, Strain CS-259" /LENGTH=884 /DNA_ID=CAMNT_0020026003 /DNA_START=21 /DNA_END=2675 /DNA_ORIENTATION=+
MGAAQTGTWTPAPLSYCAPCKVAGQGEGQVFCQASRLCVGEWQDSTSGDPATDERVSSSFPHSVLGVNAAVQLFAQRLQAEGIDVSKWGNNHMRRVQDLYEDAYIHRTCKLTSPDKNGKVTRIVRLIKVRILSDIFGVEHVLVSRLKIADSSEAISRKQLPLRRLAFNTKMGIELDRVPPEDVPKLLAEDSPYSEDWVLGCKLVLRERLALSAEWQASHMEEDVHAHVFRVESDMQSASFPGLKTSYAIHEVIFRILDPAAPDTGCLGLPSGQEFITVDGQGTGESAEQVQAYQSEGAAQKGTQMNLWSWERHGAGASKQTIKRVPIPVLAGKVLNDFRKRSVSDLPDKGPNTALRLAQLGRETLWEQVQSMANRISDPAYNVAEFQADLSAFPELDLYLLDGDMLGGAMRTSRSQQGMMSSGRTMGDEYQRTVGAFFAIFWLMRLHMDGKEGFTFGVDENYKPYTVDAGEERLYPAEKRMKFYSDNQWDQMQQLLIDAELLVRSPAGKLEANHKRVVTILALTAVHDIMKVQKLLPAVQEKHAPYHGYKAGEVIGDHDHALSYLMDYYPELLPSYHGLEPEEKKSVQFTQCQLQFNQGWLVQAEAPPGAIFTIFRQVMKSAQNEALTSRDVALYFAHWLTDLAGAEPTPLAGCEKFVVKFPLAVLNSFLRSFKFVQLIATKNETEVMEEYLKMRWSEYCSRPCTGPDAIAKMRLLCMAQMNAERILAAFPEVPQADRDVLCVEMARTGCSGQSFSPSLVPTELQGRGYGPALLVYYGPAFLQSLGSDNPVQRLSFLAEVYRGSRALWPLSEERVGESVTVRIDAIKGLGVDEIRKGAMDGDEWIVVRKNTSEAFVELRSKSTLAEDQSRTGIVLRFPDAPTTS